MFEFLYIVTLFNNTCFNVESITIIKIVFEFVCVERMFVAIIFNLNNDVMFVVNNTT